MGKLDQLLRGVTGRAGTLGRRALATLSAAGQRRPASKHFEQLEQRDYMFALTILPGQTQATARFAYFIPVLQVTLPPVPVREFVAFPTATTARTNESFNNLGAATDGGPQAFPPSFVNGINQPRVFGASITITGNPGDTVLVFDLLGRAMVQTLAIGTPQTGSPLLGGFGQGLAASFLGPIVPPIPPALQTDPPTRITMRSIAPGLIGVVGADNLIDDSDVAAVPRINDGIGRIVLVNGGPSTTVQVSGGIITSRAWNAARTDPASILDEEQWEAPLVGATLPPAAENRAPQVRLITEGSNPWRGATDTIFEFRTGLGLLDAFQAAGMGFGFTDPRGGPQVPTGLPSGLGNVIVGSPFIRTGTTSLGYWGVNTLAENQPATASTIGPRPINPILPDVELNFRTLQVGTAPGLGTGTMGFDTLLVPSFGGINVSGILIGTVRTTGSLGFLATQHLYGDVVIDGDLGRVIVGGQSGYWVQDDQLALGTFNTSSFDGTNNTDNQIFVGGVAGVLQFAGRNTASVQVLGDTQNARARLSFGRYIEMERILGTNPTGSTAAALNTFFGTPTAYLFGQSFYRNGPGRNAEFVASPSRSVTITGSVGAADPINPTEDVSDTYAFAGARGQQITADINFQTLPQPPIQYRDRVYARIYDQDGRLVATHQLAWLSQQDRINGTESSVRLQFTPEADGVYFIEIGSQLDQPDNAIFFRSQQPYTIALNGIAPTSLGMYSTGGGSRGSVVSVANGNVGWINTGADTIGVSGLPFLTGGTGGGSTRPPWDPTNEPNDAYLETVGFTADVGGNLFGYTVGADQVGATITVGGDLGRFTVQQNLISTTLSVGGSIGDITVANAIGYQNSPSARRQQIAQGSFVLSTGTSGDPGNIGRLRVGTFANGNALTLTTSSNSTIDQFIVGAGTPSGNLASFGRFVLRQPTLNLGSGSNIRFASFLGTTLVPIGSSPVNDYFIPLVVNTPLTLTDDSGVTFTITIVQTGTIFGTPSSGIVRLIPAGPGVTVGGIEADLQNGAQLNIASTSTGVLGLDRIVVNTTRNTSRVNLTGPGTIDVRSLTITGAGVDTISNTTPRGSFMSVTTTALTTFFTDGDLGRVQSTLATQNMLAPVRNLLTGQNAVVIPDALLGTDVNDQVNVPFNWTGSGDPQRTLEDIGSPVDQFANGLYVSTGAVASVRANGAVGDVILQGGIAGGGQRPGVLTSVVANADNINTSGLFEGIIGNILASDVNSVDVGDGLLSPGSTPFARASIVAYDDIGQVNATRAANPQMNGIIIAGNVNNTNQLNEINTQGIGGISIRGGAVDGMFIGVSTFDTWWRSARYAATRDITVSDPETALIGSVGQVTITNSSFTRSRIFATLINTVQITGGSWDASQARAVRVAGQNDSGLIRSIRADNFRNSTTQGDALSNYVSSIRAELDIGNLTVNNPSVGVISDQFIAAGRALTGSINARDILRSSITFAASMTRVNATRDIIQTTVNASRVATINAGRNIINSTIAANGAIETVTAGGSIDRVRIDSNGPDGRINTITAANSISGDVLSSGPIGTVRATAGDIDLTITTTDATDGTLNTVFAGRDLNLSMNVVGVVTTLQAGRDIGRRDPATGAGVGQLAIPTSVSNIIAGGVIYSDIFVGGTINSVVMGRARSFQPGADFVSDAIIQAASRINTVTINGDFNGSIIANSGGIGTVTITNGSFRAGADGTNRIEARQGDITTVTITRGHLLGDVLALNGSITTINVTGDTIFGDIGVNGALSTTSATGVAASERRNQLPPGAVRTAGRDGPTIYASRDIGTINAAGGIFEASISAGRNINTINAGRGIDFDLRDAVNTQPVGGATFIGAGDLIQTVSANQRARGATIQGGILLGADRLPGGTGENADIVQSGRVGTVTFRGGADNNTINAGVLPGADGILGNDDDRAAPGLSTITTVSVTGTNSNNIVTADTSRGTVTGIVHGTNGNIVNVVNTTDASQPTFSGSTAAFTVFTSAPLNRTVNGSPITITYTGPANTAFWDPATSRVVLVGSTNASTLRITSTSTLVNGLGIISSDDSSLGSLVITAPLFNPAAGPTIAIDGSVNTLQVRSVTDNNPGNSAILIGQNITTLNTGAAGAPGDTIEVSAREITTLTTTGGLGTLTQRALVQAGNFGNITINGAFVGTISSDRDINQFRVTGAMTNLSAVRAGGNIGNVQVGATAVPVGLDSSIIAAGGNIGATTITGSVVGSLITAGVDLGRDGAFGGTGRNADRLSDGNIASITITGAFTRSNISAGIAPGVDNLLGTADDRSASGRSALGNVTITGAATGSSLNTQSFRITSNGSIGTVRAAGVAFVQSTNLKVEAKQVLPLPLQVSDISVTELGGLYTASIVFNQPIDPNSIAGALSIFELRGAEPGTAPGQRILLTQTPAGQTLLQSGADYAILGYDPATRTVTIRFNNNTNFLFGPANPVTNRPLVQPVGLPPGDNTADLPAAAAPGVYRFVIASSGPNRLRGQTDSQTLDGNSDGTSAASDDFSSDLLIGDAGDRLTRQFGSRPDPVAGPNAVDTSISFYGPVNLDVLMTPNSPAALPGRPATNSTYTVRGIMGDHPAYNPITFDRGSDVDLYSLTIRQGQLLILGGITGSAFNANVSIIDAVTGNPVTTLRNIGGSLLATADVNVVIMVTSSSTALDLATADSEVGPGRVIANGDIINLPATGGSFGNYAFTVTILDDGNNGFGGTNDAGNGTAVPVAPLPSSFAGTDGALGTIDDLYEQIVGDLNTSDGFRLNLDPGPNRIFDGNGTPTRRSDDIISGTNRFGDRVTYTSGTDGIFGTTDDVALVQSANGNATNGNTATAFTDADVWHLNNRNSIDANTRYRFTLRVADSGGNLGQSLPTQTAFNNTFSFNANDNRGNIQFSLFETGGPGGVDAGQLVFAPRGINAWGGTPNTVLANDGRTSYGYDSRGDFYMEVVIPPSQLNPANPGTYALYVQGALTSTYRIEITKLGTTTPLVQAAQNFVIETSGGIINWLDSFAPTNLAPFSGLTLANVDGLGGQSARNYTLSQLIIRLNVLFAVAGVPVNVSLTANDFVGQQFSTIFLTDTIEPRSEVGLLRLGASQGVDVGNANRSDQAVVFAPTIGSLGFPINQAGIDAYVVGLTSAIARRMGELMGVRITAPTLLITDPVAVESGNSPESSPDFNVLYGNIVVGGLQRLPGTAGSRLLTNFAIGQQDTTTLLRRLFGLA